MSDTQPVAVPTGGEYGQRQALEQAQRVQPVAGRRSAAPGQLPASRPGAPGPGEIPGLGDPSVNPDEAVTTGLPMGPGAGPEALGLAGPPGDIELAQLKAAYMRFPTDALRRIIEFAESQPTGSDISDTDIAMAWPQAMEENAVAAEVPDMTDSTFDETGAPEAVELPPEITAEIERGEEIARGSGPPSA